MTQQSYESIQSPFQLVYKYYCDVADVAVIFRQDQAFRARLYRFSSLDICTNAPIHVGDCLSPSCCEFHNGIIGLLDHFKDKYPFNDRNANLKYVYGMSVDSLTHRFVAPGTESYQGYNGDINCTVYIELSGHPDQDNRDITIEDWKSLIPEWDQYFEPCETYRGTY